MGNEQSNSNITMHPYMGETYTPITSSRSHEDLANLSQPKQGNQLAKMPEVIKSCYYGIWSVHMPSKIGPCPRIGHFFVHDEEKKKVFVGFGMSNGVLLNDIWTLDTTTKEWARFDVKNPDNFDFSPPPPKLEPQSYPGVKFAPHHIKIYNIHNDQNMIIQPKTGLVATIFKDTLIIFGGYRKGQYVNELHVINLNTHEVRELQTTGDIPAGRSSPILKIIGMELFLWGGFNGEWPNDLSVLDLKTLKWTSYKQSVKGRTAMPSAIYHNKIISYGSSKSGGMIVIDPETKKVRVFQTTGSEPPSQVMSAGMILADDYIIYFGGKANTKFTLVYGLDIQKRWWFVFHIKPDNKTVSMKDGCLSDIGLFMVPRIHSFGVYYDSQKRQVVAFLGAPQADPAPLFIVSIGEALSFLNLRRDMLSALQCPPITN